MFELAIVIVLALCVFLVSRIRVAFSLSWVGTTILGVLIVALIAAAFVPSYGGDSIDIAAWRPVSIIGYIAVTYLPYLSFGLIPLWVVDVIWRRRNRKTPDPELQSARAKTRVTTIRSLTIAIIVIAAGVVGYGYWRALTPDINQVEFEHQQVPEAFDGYRIALVTDLHIGPTRSSAWLQERVDQINAQNVDLILIVGDLVDGTPEQIGDEMLPILDLHAADGVFITTGNHEYYSNAQAWVDFWEEHGIPVLTNKAVVITRSGQSIDLIGINDRTGRPPLAADVAEAVATLPSAASDVTRFRLLAAHQPVQALAGDNLAAQLGIDLQVSGHTHGGQVWPVHYLAKLQQGVLDGVHELGGVTVVTSRGAGAWGPPVRIGAPPEIIVITLHRP
ncbi:MAG: metallophosphoesterase [Propionibacteriaceae bacterium]|jgi:predicted MPP superfamily phosphohydrolase|nr:metallophosphoesterase [Propionibacteriaceae bacterium]